MANWTLQWTDQAVRDLSALDKAIARRVVRKLEQALRDPPRYFLRLTASDDHKLRVGDYRVLVLLAPMSRVVLVERVDHRSRIYDRRH